MTAVPSLTPDHAPLSQAQGGKVRLTAVTPAAAPQGPETHRFDARARSRADLLRVYSGLLGVEVLASDILESIATEQQPDQIPGQPVQADTLARALAHAGLLAGVEQAATLDGTQWPALALMTSGQVLLVVGQSRDELVIYDTTCPDNRAHVALADFAPFFTGTLVRAEAPIDRIVAAHVTDAVQAHWFWGTFAQFRRQFAEVALGSLVGNMLAVAVALFSLQVYDRVIPHQSEATLWVLAVGALLALLMEALVKGARAALMDGAGRQIELGVQEMLMDRLLGMRSDLKGRQPSHLFATMREFGSVREFFTASTVGTLADIPFIFLFLMLVASIAGPVVWVLLAGAILMVLPGLFFQGTMVRLTHEMQGASAKSSRMLHETLFELDTVKTQRAEDRVRRLWTELTALTALKSSEQRRIASALSIWSAGVQQATYVAAVVAGAYLVFQGQLTVGSIIATGILTSRTLAPLTQLANLWARWTNVKAALDAMEGIVDAPQDADSARTYLRRETLKGQFELREVQFRYDADCAPAIDIPALMIQPGQHLAILGANGSGKSTFLKMLTGLYAPTRGTVMIDGTDMAQIEPRDLRRLIGYLGADVRLFAGTLRDNLNLTMLERDDARLMQALDFAGLGPFVAGHPKGLDLPIQDGGAGLSSGQRQSIGWARLWLQNPRVVLLDEPTATLDQTLETTIVSRLGGWLDGRTAIIATHRVPILQLTGRVTILQGGRLAVDGPRDQVLAHLARSGVTAPVPVKGGQP